ncbi:hypothetical protein HYH03_006139 [Edaphochlamys debaryana]|uniref:Uncharacterized protein n=1 Tax=Edaphochlamys debaryana TaxID=47281 RepID=A0A835Y3P7_9CHLO|nr:hypothetical protein HYH03_006139 [Edaphochlamys debaryana]|eukprot:KAG2495902.1 hypothetical protein HYH03_006139 [Edaphochlamys debaryana]
MPAWSPCDRVYLVACSCIEYIWQVHPDEDGQVHARPPPPPNFHPLLKKAVNLFDAQGFTPLMLACKKGHAEMAHLLLAQGADPWLGDRLMGRSALHFAAMLNRVGCIEELLRCSFVVKAGTIRETECRLVDYPSNAGHTPLHYAAVRHTESVLALCRHGADPNARCWNASMDSWVLANPGSTPLHVAAKNQNLDAAVAIMQHWACDLKQLDVTDPRVVADSRKLRPYELPGVKADSGLHRVLDPSTAAADLADPFGSGGDEDADRQPDNAAVLTVRPPSHGPKTSMLYNIKAAYGSLGAGSDGKQASRPSPRGGEPVGSDRFQPSTSDDPGSERSASPSGASAGAAPAAASPPPRPSYTGSSSKVHAAGAPPQFVVPALPVWYTQHPYQPGQDAAAEPPARESWNGKQPSQPPPQLFRTNSAKRSYVAPAPLAPLTAAGQSQAHALALSRGTLSARALLTRHGSLPTPSEASQAAAATRTFAGAEASPQPRLRHSVTGIGSAAPGHRARVTSPNLQLIPPPSAEEASAFEAGAVLSTATSGKLPARLLSSPDGDTPPPRPAKAHSVKARPPPIALPSTFGQGVPPTAGAAQSPSSAAPWPSPSGRSAAAGAGAGSGRLSPQVLAWGEPSPAASATCNIRLASPPLDGAPKARMSLPGRRSDLRASAPSGTANTLGLHPSGVPRGGVSAADTPFGALQRPPSEWAVVPDLSEDESRVERAGHPRGGSLAPGAQAHGSRRSFERISATVGATDMALELRASQGRRAYAGLH